MKRDKKNPFNKKSSYIIAEIGVNHNGDIKLAKRLIKKAKMLKADAVKFQSFKADILADKNTPKVGYQKKNKPKESHYEMLKKLELNNEDQANLNEFCIKNDIDFLSTPYDIDSAKFLNSLNVKAFKIASADIVDLPLHEYVASTKKPVIISVGMATLEEIDFILNIYNSYKSDQLALLHTTSNYPASDQSLNMEVIDTLKERYKIPIGYSDHSIGVNAAIIAISKGVKIIERHFTMDRSMDGPDHFASSSPDDFKDYVDQIKKTEIMLGSQIKKCQPEEEEMKKISRKSLFLNKNIIAGKIICKEDLISKRPGNGIYPNCLNQILGKKFKKDLYANQQLKWSHIDESS